MKISLGLFLLAGALAFGQGPDYNSIAHRPFISVTGTPYFAKGDGVKDDTAAINAAIAFLKSQGGGTLNFPIGTFNNTGIIIGGAGADNITIACNATGGTTLRHTGSGAAVYFGQVVTSGGNYGQGMRDCSISGGVSTTIGLSLQGVNHGMFSNIRIKNAPTEFQCQSCVVNTFMNIRASNNETGTTIPCVNGMVFDYDPASPTSNSQANTIINPIIEGCSGSHFWMKHAALNYLRGGTAENGSGTGIKADSTSFYNTFDGMDTESLGTQDYLISGLRNVIRGALAAGATNISGSGAFFTVLEDSTLPIITDAGYGTRINNVRYTAGSLTLSGSHTDQMLNQTTLNVQDPWSISTPLTVAGTVSGSGLRPVVMDGGIGNPVTKQGDSGGWSFAYAFRGSAGAELGGFGASGSGDALGSFFIGIPGGTQLALITTSVVGGGKILVSASAVSALPACTSTIEGTRMSVNNSNAASFTAGIGAVVAGGGSTHVPVVCDGTNWRIG